MSDQPFAIDRFIEEHEAEANNKISAALRMSLENVRNRMQKKEHTMEKTADLLKGIPTSAPAKNEIVTPTTPAAAKPVTAKPAAKKKAAPAKKAAKPAAKKKVVAKKKTVKTHSKHLGRKAKYTKEFIMALVKKAKTAKTSFKKTVMSTKSDKDKNYTFSQYVAMLVASRKVGIILSKLFPKK